MDVPVGRVTKYYDTIGVAVVVVGQQPLQIGDTIRIVGMQTDYVQKISSLQKEYREVDRASPGDVIGLATTRPVETDDRLFLVSK